MKALICILSIVLVAFGQFNYSGYRDTTAVSSFNADSTGVTKAFELSRYENIRLIVFADDTSEAGYASDSIKFSWGIELGDVILNSSNVRDTTWQGRYIVDTFDILTAANSALKYSSLDSMGRYNKIRGFIDTSYVTGWAVQDVEPFDYIPWAPIFRFWYIGLTGNITGSYVKLMFGQSRRLHSNVHNQ